VMGLLLGGAIVFARNFPFGVFRTSKQVTDATGLQCAVLPEVVSAEEQASLQIGEYALDWPYSRFAQTLRSIWATINIAQGESAAKIFCVVSSNPGEGKTTVAINLAAQLARHSATRVLVIDADFYRQSLTQRVASRRTGRPQRGLSGAKRSRQICRQERAPESRRPSLSCPRSHAQRGGVARNS